MSAWDFPIPRTHWLSEPDPLMAVRRSIIYLNQRRVVHDPVVTYTTLLPRQGDVPDQCRTCTCTKGRYKVVEYARCSRVPPVTLFEVVEITESA